MSHAHSNGLRPKINTQGHNNGYAKLTETQVIQIRQLIADGKMTQREIASQFGVARRTISDIKTNKRWKHLNLTMLFQAKSKLYSQENKSIM